jgi:teichuronic acid biosynthesis glycosyltransferase TuaC
MPTSKHTGLRLGLGLGTPPPSTFEGTGALRVLAVTRNFPNRLEPLACAFQRQQLACLGRRASVEVLATIPYLPGSALLGDRTRAGRLRDLPRREAIDGLPVVHPRVPYVPGVSRLTMLAPLNAPLYLAGLLPYLPALRGRFDVVLGTHLFPDACAAVAAAQILGLPCVVKAHGTDVNVVARWPSIQPILAWALGAARFSAGVSRPLVNELLRLGAPSDRAVLLPNGVDRAVFHPQSRAEARRALGLPEPDRIVLYVGGLEPEKGLVDLCAAFEVLRADAPSPVHLVLVGEGALDPWLRTRAASLGAAAGRLILAGPQDLAGVARFLAAADVLALPSWAEGTPNVVLEALASGRPVVASRVGGIPDAIIEGTTGLLVPPRDVDELTLALRASLARRWDEAAIVASAPPSWDESAERLFELLWEAARGRMHAEPTTAPNGARNGAAKRGVAAW